MVSNPGTGDVGFIVVETNYRIYAYTGMSKYWNSLVLKINMKKYTMLKCIYAEDHYEKKTGIVYISAGLIFSTACFRAFSFQKFTDKLESHII